MIKLFLTLSLCTQSSWYAQKLEGWYYFQEEGRDPLLSTEDAALLLADEKRQLEGALSLAILSPTKEHVQNYLVESKRQRERSARFADAWGEIASQKEWLKDLAHTYFLLVYVSENDALSIQATQTAQKFAETHGWKFRTLSLERPPSFYAVNPENNEVIFLGEGDASLLDLEQKIIESIQ